MSKQHLNHSGKYWFSSSGLSYTGQNVLGLFIYMFFWEKVLPSHSCPDWAQLVTLPSQSPVVLGLQTCNIMPGISGVLREIFFYFFFSFHYANSYAQRNTLLNSLLCVCSVDTLVWLSGLICSVSWQPFLQRTIPPLGTGAELCAAVDIPTGPQWVMERSLFWAPPQAKCLFSGCWNHGFYSHFKTAENGQWETHLLNNAKGE